jgi:hypothetical protein
VFIEIFELKYIVQFEEGKFMNRKSFKKKKNSTTANSIDASACRVKIPCRIKEEVSLVQAASRVFSDVLKQLRK